MNKQFLFKFKTDISCVYIPSKLNNPFSSNLTEIAEIAAKEFQEFITLESKKWNYDFSVERGKMFGVLVVKKKDNTYFYLGTVSGKLPKDGVCKRFIPSVFDESVDDFFINKHDSMYILFIKSASGGHVVTSFMLVFIILMENHHFRFQCFPPWASFIFNINHRE